MLATRQKFGKFVLLRTMRTSGLGSEVRAAKTGPEGMAKIVTLLQLDPVVSANSEVAKRLMAEARVAAQLQSPSILKLDGIGKVNSVYYISYELVEGKNLKEMLERCWREGLAPSVDHALLIASKVCSALEYAHSRRNPDGSPYFHGLLTPSNLMVSYEGDVRVGGFGYWPSGIGGSGVLTEEDSCYLAPEQLAGGMGDARSDLFAVGAILFELLTGQPLAPARRASDLASELARARSWSPGAADESLPKAMLQMLQRTLAEEPADRFAEILELRNEIDSLLFSGDFTPKTLNLAFLMHSLFREDIEMESTLSKEDAEDGFQEFLTPQAGAASAASPAIPARAETSSLIAPPPVGAQQLSPREAASAVAIRRKPRRTAVLTGIAALLTGYYFGIGPGTGFWAPPAAPAAPAQEALALQDARVRELEDKIASLEKGQQAEKRRKALSTLAKPAVASRKVAPDPPTAAPSGSTVETAPARPTPAPTPAIGPSSAGGRLAPAPSTAALRASTPPWTLVAAPAAPTPPPSPPIGPSSAVERPVEPPRTTAPEKPEGGVLKLVLVPESPVTVDGVSIGLVSVRELTLTPGPHVVIVLHPDYQPLQRKVTIIEGSATTLVLELARKGIPKTH